MVRELITILIAVGVALFFIGAAIFTVTAKCDPQTQHCIGQEEKK